MMFLFLMVLALIFLIAGGIGLFYTNIYITGGSHSWVQGNIAFGAFTAIGIVMLIFMAVFGQEIE